MSKTGDVRNCTTTQDGHYLLQVWVMGHGLLIIPSIRAAKVGERVSVKHIHGAWRIAA